MRSAVVTVVGTLVIHGAIALGLREIDRLVYLVPEAETPEVEIVDIEPPKPVPVPEPEPEREPEPTPEPTAKVEPKARAVRAERPRVAATAAAAASAAETASEADTATEPAGGTGPTYKMELGTRGMAVGKPGSGGRGSGTGTGTGTGTGEGTGTGAAPLSVAAIKTRAKAKKGFDYFDAGRDYPAEARRLEIEGQVKVRLVVDARGKVTEARLVTRLGHGLDELALQRARAIEFEPALDASDRPVASIVVWTVTFVLPR